MERFWGQPKFDFLKIFEYLWKWIQVFKLEIWKVWWRKCTNGANCPFRLPLAMAQDTIQTAPHMALTMFPMPSQGWEFNLSLQNPFATYLPFAVMVNVLQHLAKKATGRVTIYNLNFDLFQGLAIDRVFELTLRPWRNLLNLASYVICIQNYRYTKTLRCLSCGSKGRRPNIKKATWEDTFYRDPCL